MVWAGRKRCEIGWYGVCVKCACGHTLATSAFGSSHLWALRPSGSGPGRRKKTWCRIEMRDNEGCSLNNGAEDLRLRLKSGGRKSVE